MRQMYERAYGSKYEQAKGKSTAEIAALIRADVKAAIRAGDLPGAARNYSIRSENFAGGRAIRVSVKGLDELLGQCPGVAEVGCGHWNCEHGKPTPILTEEGKRVKKVVEAIHAAYNHNGSEAQVDYFDVNYYGQVDIERG